MEEHLLALIRWRFQAQQCVQPIANAATTSPTLAGWPSLGAMGKMGGTAARRTIQLCENISDFYEMEGLVLPSLSSDMQIRHALPKNSSAAESVVIKIRLKRGSSQNEAEEQTWRSAMEMMMNLPACGSLCQIYEVWEDASAFYVVMEKVGGMDLCGALWVAGTLPVQEVKGIMRQLLIGIAELHAHGCIHRDIKLENVMFDRTPTSSTMSDCCPSTSQDSSSCSDESLTCSVKLIDFDTVTNWSHDAVKAQEIVGTNHYLPPEAYHGVYSPASDIFASGIIMYNLLTGEFPFDDDIFDDRYTDYRAGLPEMQTISDRIKNAKINWGHQVFQSEPDARELLQKMLLSDMKLRPSATSALKHQWLAGPACPLVGDRATQNREVKPDEGHLREDDMRNLQAFTLQAYSWSGA